MSKNALIWLVIIIIVVVAGVLLLKGNGSDGGKSGNEETPVGDNGANSNSGNEQTEVKEFTLHGSNFTYDVKEIKVKVGDKVRVTFIDDAGNHDWNLEGYNVGTKVLNTGGQETVEFTADKAGTFEYYCSVGQHRQMGMKGNFIVE